MGKYLLRHAFEEDHILPESILWRQKAAFSDAVGHSMSADTIYNNCVSRLEEYNEAIILMHDASGKHTTVEALPRVIEAIQAMEDTEILPIDDDTFPIQHRTVGD